MQKKSFYLSLPQKRDVFVINKNISFLIHITLLTQKLYLRNMQYGDENVEKFVDVNNEIIVRIGYKVLIVYEKRYNENIFKYISNLYEEFSEKINELIK